MGLGVEQQPDGSYQSQILMQAESLRAVQHQQRAGQCPFVVQGGQTFISQALIANGWIQNAMIAM